MKIIKNIEDRELKDYKCISLDTEWTKNYKIKNGNKPKLLKKYTKINVNYISGLFVLV